MLNTILVFTLSGWCEKLQKSYFAGRYQPKDKKEFEALKEFASEIIELKPIEEKKSEKIGKAEIGTVKADPSSEIEKTSDGIPESMEEVKEYTEEQIADLRAKAKEAKIHNWHSKNPNTLAKELGIDE